MPSAEPEGSGHTTRLVIGVDVGGTFTDIFVFDEMSGKVTIAKAPSTRDDQSEGFIEGTAGAVDAFADIRTVVHGTTVGTNALLERKGAHTGIITTEGFRDLLEMRRRDRPTTWGLRGSFEPFVARGDRLEVRERVLADGSLLQPVNEDDVRTKAEELQAAGCEAVCVFFINGYANDDNEKRAALAVRSVWPNSYVTAATEILPEIREFERLSTATLNAYLQPVVSSYLARLEARLSERNFGGDVLIVQSNGGVMAMESAKRYPVRTALSGPAAGVIAGRAIAKAAGFENIITCDMGGTSFDVSLITAGEASLAAQTSIDLGMVVRTPMIEITTIGAGGGSIAYVDPGGLLQVGPVSAGSDPGPVCYGFGNKRPTVTDANLVLGRIDPDRPIGGKLERLDMAAARCAIEVEIGKPLGLTIENAAEAILRIANAKMAGAIRLVSIERGHDPATFVAMPFGGGALHAGALVKDVGLGAALVPRFPGVTSALGCVVADMRHDRVQTVNRLLDQIDAGSLGQEMKDVADRAEALVRGSGVTFEMIDRHVEFDMLYLGQTHTIVVPMKLADGDVLERDAMRTAFEAAYRGAFGRLLCDIPIRLMNYRVAVIGRRPAFDMKLFAPPDGRPPALCLKGHRKGRSWNAPVYDRLALETGAIIEGPALLEQSDTTIFIDPGLKGQIDHFGNLLIEPQKARP